MAPNDQLSKFIAKPTGHIQHTTHKPVQNPLLVHREMRLDLGSAFFTTAGAIISQPPSCSHAAIYNPRSEFADGDWRLSLTTSKETKLLFLANGESILLFMLSTQRDEITLSGK